MSFTRPSLSDLIDRATADLISRLEIKGIVLLRAVIRVIARRYGQYGISSYQEA